MTEMIICGLTSFEKKIIENHRGECEWCNNYYDKTDEKGNWLQCSKGHEDGNLNNDCKDWRLDTR